MAIKVPSTLAAPKSVAQKPAAPAPKAAPPAPPKPATVAAAKPAPAAPAAKPAPAAAPKPAASKPAPASPAPKAASPSPAAKASDPVLEARVTQLEEILAGFATMYVPKQRFDVYLAGYTGDEASWEFTADPEAGPSFKPNEAPSEDLRLYVWQYSDGDYTQDEKGLRKLAKAIKAKGDLKISDRAKESPLPPLESVEAQEEAQEEEEAEQEEEASEETSMSVDEVDTATIDQVHAEALRYEIDTAPYAKKPAALRALLKKAIAERLAAQEAEAEGETESEEEEAQGEEFTVGDTVLVYAMKEDGSPDASQEALQGSVTAIGDPDGDGDRPHTVRFPAEMLDACKEAFGDNCKVLMKKDKTVTGITIVLPSASWLTRPAE